MPKFVFDDHKDLFLDLKSEYYVDYLSMGTTRVVLQRGDSVVLEISRYQDGDLKTISDIEYQVEFNGNATMVRKYRLVDSFLGCKALGEVHLWKQGDLQKEARLYFLKKNRIAYMFALHSNENYSLSGELVKSIGWTGNLINPPVRCETCSGKGILESFCQLCNGAGVIYLPENAPGFKIGSVKILPCRQCNYKRNQLYKNACNSCYGWKYTFNTKPGTSKR